MAFLEGTVERVTYFNAENGYSVIRLKPARGDLVTLVGNLPELTPGEFLKLQGEWTAHAEYGRQFRVDRCEQALPATVEGIRRYLGSGLIKGVGPKTAERIVAAFGRDTLDVIDREPGRLREVPDIGPKRYRLIREAWEAQKHIKEVMIFLQGQGISTGLAVKIYKHYGDDSLEVVKRDPYQLARDIWGIGFRTADKIARALGLPLDAPTRLEAGLAHVLSESADNGHVYVPEPELIRLAAELLEIAPDRLPDALERLEASRRVQRELLPLQTIPAVYLMPFYQAETHVAELLLTLLNAPTSYLRDLARANWDQHFAALDGGGQTLSEQQRQGVQTALTNKVTILTGGPGTGKTTTLRTLIQLLERTRHTFVLASPTGRAAKRLAEATGRPAKTIHRLLGFSPMGDFEHNEQNRLPAHMVVVDETSMLDTLLTNNLLKAIDPASHLLLVGDVDQLPSVGAGNVLRDLIASGRLPVIRLQTIFRQAAGSHIVTNAHRVNRGEMPVFAKEAHDFFLFPEDEAEAAADRVVEVVQHRIPRRFGLDPLTDIQVLSPMHRGASGVGNLNLRLQAALNPPAASKPERQLSGRLMRVGDRVMQIRNNYQKEAYNGDIGRVVHLDLETQTLTVDFEGRPVLYEWSEADELVHAFAVSVHKAQGSEFPAVVVPVLTQHYLLLQRNLLYTAITRARQLCVVIGMKRALGIAVRNAQVAKRWTGLAARLQSPIPIPRA